MELIACAGEDAVLIWMIEGYVFSAARKDLVVDDRVIRFCFGSATERHSRLESIAEAMLKNAVPVVGYVPMLVNRVMLKETLLHTETMFQLYLSSSMFIGSLFPDPVFVVYMRCRLFAIPVVPGVHIADGDDGKVLIQFNVNSRPGLVLHRFHLGGLSELSVDKYGDPLADLEVRSDSQPLNGLRDRFPFIVLGNSERCSEHDQYKT